MTKHLQGNSYDNVPYHKVKYKHRKRGTSM